MSSCAECRAAGRSNCGGCDARGRSSYGYEQQHRRGQTRALSMQKRVAGPLLPNMRLQLEPKQSVSRPHSPNDLAVYSSDSKITRKSASSYSGHFHDRDFSGEIGEHSPCGSPCEASERGEASVDIPLKPRIRGIGQILQRNARSEAIANAMKLLDAKLLAMCDFPDCQCVGSSIVVKHDGYTSEIIPGHIRMTFFAVASMSGRCLPLGGPVVA